MTLMPYEAEMYDEIATWWRARGKRPPAPARLPVNGFVVPGVACAFFYLTDTETAIVEYCATNPSSGLKQRYAAMHEIAVACVKGAARLGYKHVALITPFRGIASFARALGSAVSKRGADFYVERKIGS